MLHLSDVAIDYIFERFQSVLISQESILFSKNIEKIKKAMHHRPFKSDSQEYTKFLEVNIQEINKLAFNFPNISFKEELDFFENKLSI
jgi:hypothetical protein